MRTTKSDIKLGRKYRAAVEEYGSVDAAAEALGVKRETVRRKIRYANSADRKTNEVPDAFIEELKKLYNKNELNALIKGKKSHRPSYKAIHDFSGDRVKFGFLTDTHIGSKYFNEEMLNDAFEMFSAEGVDFICHTGDLTEGMYNQRAGHALECTELGYDRQLKRAVELFKPFDAVPIYIISGNHDHTYIKQSGADIVEHFCNEVDNAKYLGCDEGDFTVGNANIKLWHGGDGSSYATSYRVQKVVESFTGGEKPDVWLGGHTHKQIHMFERHVHCLSGGCIERQSKWMRGKRLAAHTGFWVADMTLNDSGVGRFSAEWFPFYV